MLVPYLCKVELHLDSPVRAVKHTGAYSVGHVCATSIFKEEKRVIWELFF